MVRNKPNLGNPRNRPQIPIDWNMVDKYLEADCNGVEISGVIGCSPDTLYDRCHQEKGVSFTAYSAQKRSKGDALLRAKQFTEAMKGDRGMLVWLGKNRLGQKDEPNKKEEFNGKLMELLDILKIAKGEVVESKEASDVD